MYKKILVVRLDRIGDVLLSTPVIKVLRQFFPDSRIAFLAAPRSRQILEGNPYLDEVIIYDKKLSFAGHIEFIQSLSRERFQVAIILHPTLRTHILTFLAGIPERIGYDRKGGWLLTKRIPHKKQFGMKHETDYTLDLLRYIGLNPGKGELFMPVTDACKAGVKDTLERNGIRDGDTVVVLNPGASCPSKRWDAGRFAKIGDMLSRDDRVKIIVIAGPSDKTIGDKAASLMKEPCVNLSGRTTIEDVAGLLCRTRLFISNDSGPVHIACAVGTPVVAIFGRSDRGLSPERWGPRGPNDIVLHKDVGCSVCLAHDCKLGFKCLNTISVDEVVAAARRILK